MQTLGVDDTTGKVMYSIEMKLGGGAGGHMDLGNVPDGREFEATSADLWHRRMRHLNRRSSEVLKKDPVHGTDFDGDFQPCSTCPFGKSTQQPHPKQANYGALRPFQLCEEASRHAVAVVCQAGVAPVVVGVPRQRVPSPDPS